MHGFRWRIQLLLALLAIGFLLPSTQAWGRGGNSFRSTDLLIIGGTESGCAAAVQAARMGVKSITIVNDIDWLGGQFSAEALAAIDENRPPNGYGHGVPFPRSGLFAEVMTIIEEQNRAKYGHPRPGNTRVITTARPVEAEAAFRKLLKPYVDQGIINIISNVRIDKIKMSISGNRIEKVEFYGIDTGVNPKTRRLRLFFRIFPKVVIDASDWGDVIRRSPAGYEFGPDLKSAYNEPLAPTSRDDYPLTDMNPITYCMIIEETDDYTPIPKPKNYDPRNYRNHNYPKDPAWLYPTRRIVDHYGFVDIKHPDLLLLCFPAFDYPLDVLPARVSNALDKTDSSQVSTRNIVQMTHEQRQIIFEDAKQYSLGFLYYLQTEVHEQMKDKTHSFRRFKLSEEFGTPDNLPPKPYVRESLRLKAMYMVKQQDTTGHGGDSLNYASSMFHDGIASWQFEYDFHPTKRIFLDNGDKNGPWKNGFRKNRTWGPPYSGLSLFPMRSLIPDEFDGLLAAQKNLGYTSIVSSALRLHDQSMAVGQGCGATAAAAIFFGCQPREIPFDARKLAHVWDGLCSTEDGAIPQILWPFRDLAPEHPAFVAANQLGIRKLIPQQADEVLFRANEPADIEWRQAIIEKTAAVKLGSDKVEFVASQDETRGEFVTRWWQAVKDLPDKPFPVPTNIDREKYDPSQHDTDGDGLVDSRDPLPFVEGASHWPKLVIDESADGLLPALSAENDKTKVWNFTDKPSEATVKATADVGLPFDKQRGFGWQRSLKGQCRKRNFFPDELRDTFVFTRTHDVWNAVLENGKYHVTVCLGDASHSQVGQNMTIEGQTVFENVDTRTGHFAEKSLDVTVDDGQLTVEIGKPNSDTNTCINWLVVERVEK